MTVHSAQAGSGTSQRSDQHRVQCPSSSRSGWPTSARPCPTAHAIVDQNVCDSRRTRGLMRLGSSNPSQDGQDHWRRLASRGISWHLLGIPLGGHPARNQGWPSRPSTIKQQQLGPRLVAPYCPCCAAPAQAPLSNFLGSQRSFLYHSYSSCLAGAFPGVQP